MTLSSSVPQTIEANLLVYISQWLGQHGMSIEDVGGWAVHPGGPRVLTAVEQALSLPPESLDISRQVLAEHGNMSSATLVFILSVMRQKAEKLPWLMMGFGPGLEIELALLN